MTRRLGWIQERLDKGAPYAIAWWAGWLAYATGEAAFGWVKYAGTHDRLDRDTWLVTGLGSTLWIGQLFLFPMRASYAWHQVRKLPKGTPGERRVALAEAEHILRESAQDERESLGWIDQSLDLAWAVGTTAYIFGRSWNHEKRSRVWKVSAVEFAATIAITEAGILSTPRKAIRDAEAYDQMPCSDSSAELTPPRHRLERVQPSSNFDLGIGSVSWTLRF